MHAPYNTAEVSVNPRTGEVYYLPYEVRICNGCTEFRVPKPKGKPPTPRGDRKAITTFSASSRLNLFKKFFSLSKPPDCFVSLTYPGDFPHDASIWKRHFDIFSHRLYRKFPKSWFGWRLEPQKRCAPHFHLIGSLGEYVSFPLLARWLSQTWYEVVGSGDVHHLRVGTNLRFLRDPEHVYRYVCKYLSKFSVSGLPDWARPGRYWGFTGKKNMPPSPCCHVLVSRDTYYKLRRLVRKWQAHLPFSRRSASSSRYAKRLKKMNSFFILADHRQILNQLEFTLGFSLSIDTLSQSAFDFSQPVPF